MRNTADCARVSPAADHFSQRGDGLFVSRKKLRGWILLGLILTIVYSRLPPEVYQGRGPAETAQRVWAWNQTHPLACGSRHFLYSSSMAPVANIRPPQSLEQAASEMSATPETYDSGGFDSDDILVH
ncbi:hypothetical protein N7519_005319 [Penicillium mononematosum]|uniref:uncharacterized protein n=1 Tax=Penicillium mononematosum TaxID=268346 RepID=UPI002547D78A|nr:uncharacterized protein N7519_005319 [Penicillium mononematosum]KAJ6184018.1 hypothetical protein N7519_005319 [Penicillium mononematosum]